MPKSKIIRIIPDRVFYKLWKAAEKDLQIYEYIDLFTSPLSNDYIGFRKKYKLNEIQTIDMLKNIYKAAKLSAKDIIDASGRRKADIGYIFCIPIRTLEDWYSGRNKCPSYVRLMMIRKFELFTLGKYIYIESDNHVVYNAYKGSGKDVELEETDSVVSEDLEIDNNSFSLSGENGYMMSMKEYEQLHVHNSNKDIQDIISATDYLREYMNKK